MWKKKGLWIAIVAVVVACALMLCACGNSQGKSAYELAKENGFEGTEEEWLDSLRGKDGEDGTDGQDGKDGVNGLNGQNGADNQLTVSDYYDAAVAAGYEGTMLDFIRDYLSVTVSEDHSEVIAQNVLATVNVISTFEVRVSSGFGPWAGTTTQQTSSAGSGVFYRIDKETGDAYVITNYHVVYNESSTNETHISDNITLYLYGTDTDSKISATFVGGAINYDLAVLRVEGSELLKNSAAREVVFGDSNNLIVGQTAIVIGNANGDGISATDGIVSVDSEVIQVAISNYEIGAYRVLRVDAAISGGNSGGGVYDANGKLIGIVNAHSTLSTTENMGYALPANVVKYVVENIIDYAQKGEAGGVKKCMLGITLTDNNLHAEYDPATGRTKIVADVTVYEHAATESAEEVKIAETALAYGILQNGDVIKKIAVKKAGSETYTEEYVVSRSFVLTDLMISTRVGDTVKVTYVRGEEEKTAEFTLTEDCIVTLD